MSPSMFIGARLSVLLNVSTVVPWGVSRRIPTLEPSCG